MPWVTWCWVEQVGSEKKSGRKEARNIVFALVLVSEEAEGLSLTGAQKHLGAVSVRGTEQGLSDQKKSVRTGCATSSVAGDFGLLRSTNSREWRIGGLAAGLC